MSHVYCPECGFQNPEAANYCAKCGALLVREEGDETTQTFSPVEADEALGTLDDLGALVAEGALRSSSAPAAAARARASCRRTSARRSDARPTAASSSTT